MIEKIKSKIREFVKFLNTPIEGQECANGNYYTDDETEVKYYTDGQ